MIEFAVGADVSTAFKATTAEVDEAEWRELRDADGVETGQQYAEVCFVPNGIGYSRNGPDYRFLAVREPLRAPPLPGLDEGLPAVELGARAGTASAAWSATATTCPAMSSSAGTARAVARARRSTA